ncbi:MAG: phosphoribosylaminoimidazolesuccinocarboxamide synthase [Clostridia bacterium]|nr:phosphoribosylaminoimidazolesuccinocarboxamide synthase [Clostridia bacterium]
MVKKVGNGKVRDIYDIGNDHLILLTSDRMSAFDVVLPNEVPHKGAVLNKLSAFWFDFTKDIIPNHMISIDSEDMPLELRCPAIKGTSMLVKKLKMLPVECIVRGYITGSGWSSYQKTGEVCGIKLPEGLKESEKLPEPIYTPTTKATEGHDEHISFEETVELVGEDLAKQLRDKSIEIYKKCSEYAAKKGIIIADTKFEFGVDENGVLTLADEVLTPDSSRFWPADEYEVGRGQSSYDKQYLRDWLSNSGWNKQPPAPELPEEVIRITSEKYVEIYEKLTETNF